MNCFHCKTNINDPMRTMMIFDGRFADDITLTRHDLGIMMEINFKIPLIDDQVIKFFHYECFRIIAGKEYVT